MADFASAAGVSRASFYRHFKSRDALMDALNRSPEPDARERILDAALGMVGQRGLAALSMDDLADKAAVSRATLYRLFPGKSALFTALIYAFSPLEPVSHVLNAMQNEPPDRVMPEVARAVYRTFHTGQSDRTGLLRALFFEVSSLNADTEEAMREALLKLVGVMIAYVTAQMSLGRLRRVHPLLALQSFIGPIFFHLLTREVVGRMLGITVDGEAAVSELAQLWLQAMRGEAKESR